MLLTGSAQMTANRSSLYLRLGMLLIIVTGLVIAYYFREQLTIESLTQWFGELGWLAPVFFILGYIVGTVFFLPGLMFTLAGGALFGPILGTLYNLTGATIGATLAFLASRYIAQDWARQRAGKKLGQLVEGVEREGWRFIAFVRLVPLFPFNLLNYALGLTRIKLSHYIVTSLICMAPAGAAYTYLGYVGREVASGSEDVIKKALIAVALIATVAFLGRIIMRKRKSKTG